MIVYGNIRILARSILRMRNPGLVARLVWHALLVALVFSPIDAFYIEPAWVQLTRHTIRTSKLPAGASLRIVQLSDLHLDKPGRRERRMIRLTAIAHPDLIILTGDYRNTNDLRIDAAVTEIARKLSRIAPTFAIEGNWDTLPDMRALARGGARQILGWTEFRGANGARVAIGQLIWFARSYDGRVPDEMKPLFKILLCHKPEAFDSAAEPSQPRPS